MKKFYLLLCVLPLFSFNAFTQVYSENFDGTGASVTAGVFSSGTGQPTLNTNLSITNNWTGYDHLGNLTTASDVINFCSSGKGLRGYSIPFSSSTRKFKLVLNVAAGYTLNITSIAYKHTSNINNGSSKINVNGGAYGTNVLIQQACPGQSVVFTQALSLTGQVTIELIANNAGTINNAEFAFDNFAINGAVNFTANNEFINQACIGTTTGLEARLGNAEIADFDGDNDKDIIAHDDAAIFKLFKNNGNGVFSTSTTPFTSTGLIASGDLDGDGDIDIAQSNGKIYLNNGLGVFTQLGSGIFRTSTLNIQNVKIADFNNDGKKDLLWLNASLTAGENNEIWLNTGTTGNANFTLFHSFDNNGVGPATNSAVGDIDNDGDMDIVGCSGGGWSGRVYKNNGSGTFTVSQTLSSYTGNGFLVDWDNDGDKDFLAYDGYNNWGLRLWKNDGTGTFGTVSTSSLTDVSVGTVNALVDLNNDGYLDIACSNWGGYGRFILNSGCALTPQSQALSNSSNGVRVADFNNDGKMDILCLARDSASCVYLNYLTTKTNVPLPTPPSVSTPVNYAQNATATALTATGTNLLWYTEATGGTGSATALTPSTTTVGTVSYWVSQTNANGCESDRAKIDVVVSGSCLGGTGNQARLYSPISADFDGDNDKDLIVMDEGGLYWLNKNDGTGKFAAQQILIGVGWGGLDFKDLDGDNDIDLVSTLGKVFLNNGTGTFTQLGSGTFWTATGTISVVKIADFNKDGKQDILWLNNNVSAGYNNQVWLNNGTTGNPNFALGSEFDNAGLGSNSGSVIGDIDKDGDIDLIMCSGGGWNGKVYKNNGSGVFTSSQTLATYTGNGYLVDWDKDGDNDFLAFDTYNNWGLRLWTNDGTGTFSAPSANFLTDPTVGFVRQIVDLNDDTYLDIVCSSPSGARYYLNSGCDLNLNSQVLTNANNGTAVDDFNNNGKKDIFCAARDAQSCLHLLNVSPTATIVNPPSVTTPINYAQGATATALTATGTNLKWYTAATGGTGSTTAPTPSTTTIGTTSYWVSQSNANGCESERVKIDVIINSSKTLSYHIAGQGPADLGYNLSLTNFTSCQLSVIARSNGVNFGNIPVRYSVIVNNTTTVASDLYGSKTLDLSAYMPVSSVKLLGCCASGWIQFDLSVDIISPVSSMPSSSPIVADIVNCLGQTPSIITATMTEQNGTLKWYSSIIGDNYSATAPTPSTATAGTTSYWVAQANSSGCESERAKIDVTINPRPATPTVTTPVIYCQNATASALTGTGTNLKWYNVATGGTGSATAPTPSTATVGTTSYWVSQTNASGCESDRVKIEVTVDALPSTPSVSTPVLYCQNAMATDLTANGTNLKWYTAATGGTGSTTAPTPSTITVGTTSYWVAQANSSGCESERAKIDVTINPLPPAPSVITPVNYAQGATASTLTATGSNLLWYTAATGGTGNTTAPTPNTATLGTTSYWVSQTVNGCESARAKIDVTVSSTTNATYLNFSNSYVDIGNLIPTGSSYTKEVWVKPSGVSGMNIMSSNTSAFWFWNNNLQCGHGGGFIDVYAPASDMVNKWTHVAVTYDNASKTMRLYINGNMVSQNTNVNAYNSGNIQLGAFNSGARYTGDMDEARIWNSALSADDILRRKNCELQGNEAGLIAYYKFNQGFDASTNTTVTTLTDATSNANNGTLNNFALTGVTSNWLAGSPVTTGSSIPSAPTVTTPVSYCQNGTATALTANGTNLRWYTTATGGTNSAIAPTPSTTTVGTTSYWVSSSNANDCESEKIKIDVIINALPSAPTITTPVTYCQNATATALTANGTNLKWYTIATGGTGNTIAPTPSTTTAGTTSYWVSQTENSCESERAKIDVTINPQPSAPTASNQSFCVSATVANLTASGTNIQWYASATGGSALAPTTALTTGTTYYASQTNANSCESSRTAVIVTINSTLSTPSVSTPVLYCQNAPATDLTASGSNLQWFTTATGGTGSATAPTPSTTTVGTTSYWVSQSLNGCESDRAKIEVTINPQPSAPIASNQSFCVSATVANLTATGTNIQWYATANSGSALISTAALTTGTTYYASQTNADGCESSRTAVVVTINSTLSTPSVSTPVLYCQNAVATVLTASGSNLKWYTAATGGTGSATAPTPSTATVGTTSYWVSQSLNGCESDRAKIDVTINPRPATPTVTTPVIYCQNATASALTGTGTNLKWYNVATGGTGNTTAPMPNTSITGTTSYWVSQTNASGCESDRVKIDVTINATPSTPSVSTPITYCQNAIATALTANGTNLKWYTTATGGIGSALAPTPNTSTAEKTAYWVSQTNANGCESDRVKIDITINALPSVPNITEPALSYCQGTLIPKLTATVATGITVDWYSAASNGIILQGSNVVYTASQAGTYYAQARNISTGCVNSQRAMGVITMNATPTAPSISEPTISYCEGNAMPKLIVNVATGITVDWYSAPTSGTMVQGSTTTYEPPQAGRYYAQSRNITTGCVNTQRTMGEIKMNNTPASPSISVPNVSYCEGKTIPSLIATVGTGETLDWYSAASNGTMIQSAMLVFTPTEAGTFYAQSRNIATGCLSTQRVMGTVIMNILPLAAITSSPAHICEGSPMPTLTAQVQTNETVDWYNKATGGDVYLKSSTTYTPSVAGIYFAETRNINTGCVSATRIADTISIDAIPLKPTVQALLSYCVGANTSVLTANGSNLKWYTTAMGGTANTTAPQPNTNQAGTISYFVTQTTGNNCESPRSKIDVTTEIFKNTVPKQMTLCKDQYYVFNLKNDKFSNLTHTWTSSNGYTSNKEKDTLRNSGSYFVETLTPLGCKSKDTITLSVDTTTIDANFAVATELVTVDVIKVVNISSTKNDSSRWVIPTGLKVVSNAAALLELVANDTGSYKLGLITYKGGCSAETYQNVTIYTKTFNQTDNDSLYFVKTFTAFPNPSKGENVIVKVELSKESSVRLRLIEVSTNITISDRTLPKADTHSVDYGSSLKKGSYILFLESPYGRSVLKIIVM